MNSRNMDTYLACLVFVGLIVLAVAQHDTAGIGPQGNFPVFPGFGGHYTMEPTDPPEPTDAPEPPEPTEYEEPEPTEYPEPLEPTEAFETPEPTENPGVFIWNGAGEAYPAPFGNSPGMAGFATKGHSSGLIAGIVVGVLFLIGIAVAIAVIMLRKSSSGRYSQQV